MAKKVDELLSKAIEHLEQEQYHEAIEVLTSALKTRAKIDDETISTINLNLAYSYYMLEEYPKANEHYAIGITSSEANSSEHYNYAYSLYSDGRATEAWDVLNPIIDEFKDNAYAQQLMGVIEFYKDDPDFKAALKYLKNAEKIDKNLSDPYHIGECLRLTGDYDRAIIYLKKAQQQYPDDANLHYSLGISLKNTNKTQEALSAFLQAVENNSEHASAYLEIGRIYVAKKEYEAALSEFQKAIDLGHPDAPTELQNLGNLVLGNQTVTSTSESEPKPSSKTEWQYYNFPNGEPYKHLHPRVQISDSTGSRTYPRKIMLSTMGLAAGLFIIIFAYFFTYKPVKELLPTQDIELTTRIDAEFRPISVFNEDKNINPVIRKGTVLKPIAMVLGNVLVETPWGERGLIDNGFIEQFYRVTIPKATTLFTSNDLYSGSVITENDTKAVIVVTDKNDRGPLQPVKLENGNQFWVHRVRVVSELSKLNLPTYNHKNRRLYHLESINKSLKGKKLSDALRKLGAPFGIQYNESTNTQYVVFPFAEVTQNGKRYIRTGVVLKNGIIESVKGQGKTDEYVMDGMILSDDIISTGIANLWLREFPYFITGKESKITLNFLSDYPWVAVIVRIILGIIILAMIAFAVYGLFGVPLLVLWPFVKYLGGVTFLPNWVVRWIGYFVLAISLFLFFQVSVVAFNIEWGSFWITVYAIGLAIYFFYLAGICKEYLSCTRCTSCKVLGCARDLGSIYLGHSREVTYEDVYTHSKIEGNVKTNYYERQWKVTNKYHYQDYFGCRICGKYWWWKANTYRKRGDMNHSHPIYS